METVFSVVLFVSVLLVALACFITVVVLLYLFIIKGLVQFLLKQIKFSPEKWQ